MQYSSIEKDNEGYLIDPQEWSEKFSHPDS